MTDAEVQKLLDLIERLERTPPLLELAIFKKKRAQEVNYLKHSQPEIRSMRERTKRTAPIAMKGFDPERGNLTHNLGYHVEIVSAQFDDWFAWAHEPPPYSTSRVLAITKRAKLFNLRERFERQVQKHFAPINKPPIEHPTTGDHLIDMMQESVPRLSVSVKSTRPLAGGKTHVDLEFCCLDCGGYYITIPDDDDLEGPVLCKACQQVFGSWRDVKNLAQAKADDCATNTNPAQ